MKLEILGKARVLLGAALLLGVGQLAAAPAQAQSCNEEEEIVWELLDALGYALLEFDDQFDTNPSERDCANVCKKLASGCRQIGNNFARDASVFIRTGAAAAGILCRSAGSQQNCRAALTQFRRGTRMVTMDLKADFKEICADPALPNTCNNACLFGEYPNCCEEAFGGSCL